MFNNTSLQVNLPKTNFEKESIILGIDEAGRGPVLGPMVYACCYFAKDNEEEIKRNFKFADSKVLTEDQREKIYEKMCANKGIIDFQAIIISPGELSNKMLKRNKISLNKISTDAAIQLVRDTINKGVNVREVYVDTVGKAETYQELLESKFPNAGIKFKVTAKADSLFATVSAASIVAKVTRDKEVKFWKFIEEGDDTNYEPIFDTKFGCGYPGDPITKSWMKNNINNIFGYPTLVRFSWKTTTNSMADTTKKIKLENYDDEEDQGKIRQPFISKTNNIMDSFTNSAVKKKFNYLNSNHINFTNVKI